MGLHYGRLCLSLAAWFALGASAWAQSVTQTVPAPSQVEPPVIAPPSGGGRIALPQVPAGAQIPAQAKKLSFKLLGFDVAGRLPGVGFKFGRWLDGLLMCRALGDGLTSPPSRA